MNVVMTGAGRFVEVQGTAEGAAFTRAEMDELLRWPRRASPSWSRAAKRAGCGADGRMTARLVLASNNRGKLAELQAHVRAAGIELVRQGDARHRRGRRAAPHLRRERARQGAPRGARKRLAGDRRRLGPVRRCLRRRAGRRYARFYATQFGDEKGDAQQRQRAPARAAARRAPAAAPRLSARWWRCAAPTTPSRWSRSAAWSARSRASPRGSNGFGFDPLMFIPRVRQDRRRAARRGEERAQPSRPGGAADAAN